MLEDALKTSLQLAYYLVAMVASIWALWTYRANSRRERAKWAVQLFEKFFERDSYKKVRDLLDCSSDDAAVKDLVEREGQEFTDYLNFFELVAILIEAKQISKSDGLSLFRYHLRCLKTHTSVMKYIDDPEKDYEKLRKLLKIVRF